MESNAPPLYPLRFEPIYKEKVWGGRTLAAKLGRMLPGDEHVGIGESWELVDLSNSSPSGGGGGEERSVIADGLLAGQRLHEVMKAYGDRLLGRLRPTDTGDFPLLVKFLDARENLSVQVHPSPAFVRRHPTAHLKSEAWYIVDAQPDSVIYKGVHKGVTPAQFRSAIEAGTVEQAMIQVPVKAGDCHYLPSGTCHALGAGILVAEVQTPSDTTFRVYDWGRTDRQLHIEEALDCIEFGPAEVGRFEQRSHIAGIFTTVTRLVTCEHFRIEKVRMTQGYEQELPYDQPVVWIVLEGGGRLVGPDPHQATHDTTKANGESICFQRGQTLLVPPALGATRVVLEHDTVWLEISFPQAASELIA